MAPRKLWACQPVALINWSIEAPLFARSIVMTVSILLVEAGEGVDDVSLVGASDFPIVFLPALTFIVITGLSGLAGFVALFCFYMDFPSLGLRRHQRRHEGEPREAAWALRGSHSNAPFRRHVEQNEPRPSVQVAAHPSVAAYSGVRRCARSQSSGSALPAASRAPRSARYRCSTASGSPITKLT